jgi:hypothetical protein
VLQVYALCDANVLGNEREDVAGSCDALVCAALISQHTERESTVLARNARGGAHGVACDREGGALGVLVVDAHGRELQRVSTILVPNRGTFVSAV